MPAVRTSAIILHSFPYGDTSRILRILTFDYGLRSVIAKGARGAKSRFGGILEPFTEGEAQFILRPNRDLLTLTGFSLSRSRQAIGYRLDAFCGASLIAELMLRFSTEAPDPEAYTVVGSSFNRLSENSEDSTGITLGTFWYLMTVLGFRPELEQCIRCGKGIRIGENLRFDAHGGGIVCSSCRSTGPTISAEVREDLLRMSASADEIPAPGSRRVHATLLQTFLSSHLSDGRPLRSLPLFLEQLR